MKKSDVKPDRLWDPGSRHQVSKPDSFWIMIHRDETVLSHAKCIHQCLCLFYLPAAHLRSKKHHYHVRKKRKLDPACDQSQVPPAPPASAAGIVESVSEDSCGTVAPGCTETSQESSQDTRTTDKEVPVTV